MVRTKTFILGAIALVALSLLSEPGYSLERRKKKHAKDTTEVSKPDAYGDLVKKAKITEGVVKVLTIGNDYYFEVADSLMGRVVLKKCQACFFMPGKIVFKWSYQESNISLTM